MKITARSTLHQVALIVGTTLGRHGIRAVLTGGACATIYSDGRYTSKDLDFVIQNPTLQHELDSALADVGFTREGDKYVHRQSRFWLEFPPGPLAIGGDYSIQPVRLRGRAGVALSLSPTDACRDRLAAFYYWDDRESLTVAAQIARRQDIDFAAIRRWSGEEGHMERFEEFLRKATRPDRHSGRRRRRLRR